MNNLHNKYFFYIDSDNFDNINDSYYGFILSEENNILSLNNTNNNILGGSYIQIKMENELVKIITDDISSLYIFYYIEDNFYAISNSFYDLLYNLNEKHKSLTINKLFIKQFMQSPLHVHALYDTIINEIKILPIFTNIELTKNHCNFIKDDFNMHSIDICSKSGLEIINNWINKWSKIIYSLSCLNVPIQIDLSGGFDSRVIFSLAYYSGINFNKDNINIYSKNVGSKGLLEHLGDDYIIANKIAKTLQLTLNKNSNIFNTKSTKYPSNIQYDILKNCYMGFHKEGYLCTKCYEVPHIHLGGLNGEIIRGALPNDDKLKFRFTKDPIKNDKEVLDAFYNDLKLLENESKNKFEALTKFFISNQCRTHFGMTIYNDYINNTYLISPFNDKELLKLNFDNDIDKNLIFAIIIYKTCPKIFDIEFAHNETFSEETKIKAKQLDNQYPLIKDNKLYDVTSILNLYRIYNFTYDDTLNAEDILYKEFINYKELFISKMTELFDKDYAEKIYNYSNEFYLNKDNYYPNKWIMTITSIIEVFKILYE